MRAERTWSVRTHLFSLDRISPAQTSPLDLEHRLPVPQRHVGV